jgi:hypothetical protein
MKTLLFLAILAAGCAPMPPGELYHDPAYRERDVLQTSLMKPENALIPEEGIQRLLKSRIEIPPRAKLAVHSFPHRSVELGMWTRPEIMENQKGALEALEGPLQETGRFSEITHVPRMLLPPDPSLTRMREAAALMQADLLLVYATRSERATSRHVFIANEVKVATAVEVFLMDVKTGVVPFAETFEVVRTVTQSKEDDRIAETQRRAEREGIVEALKQTAESLRRFFEKG